MVRKIVVLISGNGSNLQAIIDAIKSNKITNAKICLVISNRKAAYGITRAEKESNPTAILSLKGMDREVYDAKLADTVLAAEPTLVVLAGFMHILSPLFLDKLLAIPIINLHPALPGEFDGANAIPRAYEAFKQGKITKTGAMIHKVIAEVICKQDVPISEDDTLQDLESNIHAIEHELIVKGIQLVLGEK